MQPTRKGAPEQPLTDSDLNEEFLELVQPMLGDANAQALLAQLWTLDSALDLRLI